MVERVIHVLKEEFPGISAEEIRELPSGKVSGSVSWDGFESVDDVDRQQKIHSVLRERLGAEAQFVGLLLAYTPHELEVMRAA
jgi:hypothetical protein